MSFKTCRCCQLDWPSRGAFLGDPAVALLGYQAFMEGGGSGLFLFNHTACGTTLAIPLAELSDLWDLPVFKPSDSTETARPDLCLIRRGSRPCPPSCECTWVAGMLRTLSSWPKNAAGESRRQPRPTADGAAATGS